MLYVSAPQDGAEAENGGEQPAQTSNSSDNIVAVSGQASTHTFVLSGNSVEHVSRSNDQSCEESSNLARFSSTESSATVPARPPLTARVEISSNVSTNTGKQSSPPLKIAIKPTPTPRPTHTMTKALAPRSPSLPPTNERVESPKEDSPPASRDWNVPRLAHRVQGDATTSPQSDQRSVSSVTLRNASGANSFKNNREMFEQKSASKDVPPLKLKSHLKTNPGLTSIAISQKIIEPVKSALTEEQADSILKEESNFRSLSPEVQAHSEIDPEKSHELVEVDSQVSQAHVPDTVAQLQSTNEIALLSKEDAKETFHSPVQKTPPPVAPKPRLSSSSSTKSEGNEESEDALKLKPGPKISSGYERLQAITKSSKPSKILEKSRTIVSSKAKMFDAKTEEASSSTAPEVGVRRISVGGFNHQDGNNGALNASLKPISERRKSTGSGLITKPLSLNQQFSAAPKASTRVSTTARRPMEITIPETSPRDSASQDSKVKTVMSPTRLNSALSPRRTSSVDSPMSPSVSYSPKQVTSSREKKTVTAGDKYQSNLSSSKEQSGIFKYSSVTVHGRESPVKFSPKNPISPSQSPPNQTPDHNSKSFTAPISTHYSSTPALTSQVSEEHLENTMKMFDDLLMDTPVVRTETDPVDLLLWAPVRMDSPRSARSDLQMSKDKDQSISTAPVAKPRSKPFEETLKLKDVKLNNTVPTMPAEDSPNIHLNADTSDKTKFVTNIPQQMPNTPKQQIKVKQNADVQEMLSRSNSDNFENIVAVHVAEGIVDIKTPKENQRVEIHSMLGNQNTENIKDNIVAAQVSERIDEERAYKKKQNYDVHSKLTSMTESDLKNIVATELSNSMSQNVPLKRKQMPGTKAILCDQPQSNIMPTDNIVAMQISTSVEMDGKEMNGSKSTEYVTNLLGNECDDNIVANNLSEEITVNTNSLLKKERTLLTEANEQKQEESLTEATESIPPNTTHLTNGHRDDSLYKEHAQKIVEVVLTRVKSDSSLDFKPEESQSETLLNPDEEEEEPPPLPGAPPPPLILRNPVLLVSEQDLVDQGGSSVVPEGLSSPDYQQDTHNTTERSTVSDAFDEGTESQTIVDTAEVMNFETPRRMYHITTSRSPSTEMVSGSDSVEPLNSTGGSVSEGESHRFANSRSPDDMLSEDSGMPADEEFQEGATDDAISPPGEYADTDLALRSVNRSLSPPRASPSEDQSHPVEQHEKPAIGLELNSSQVIPVIEVCDSNEYLPPPLPTTSQPPITTQSVSGFELDLSHPQTSSEDSPSPLLSHENTSHGDEVTYTQLKTTDSFSDPQAVFQKEKVICVQETSISKPQHFASDFPQKDKDGSTELISETTFVKASESTNQTSISQLPQKESVSSEETDTEDVFSVTSSRKWCFRSNSATTSPLAQADPGTNATITYTDAAVISVLPPSGLVSLLEKANSVLDKAENSSDLELRVVHLSRTAESRELGVDLKHDGGIWFRVSLSHYSYLKY